jgi:hypothetical protein
VEVRTLLSNPICLFSHVVSQASAGASAGTPVTVWVKRMDVAGARYTEVEAVDLQQSVSKFTARWVAQAKLDVDPSLVTLRLVPCTGLEPTADEEAAAEQLRPRLTLAAAGVTDGCSLLAFVAGAPRAAHLCVSLVRIRLLRADCVLESQGAVCRSWTPLWVRALLHACCFVHRALSDHTGVCRIARDAAG